MTSVAGFGVTVIVASGGAVIAKVGDVAGVSTPELATRVYPTPAWLSEMLLNVATPATAATVTVPESDAVSGFTPMVSVTLPVKVVASRLLASPRLHDDGRRDAHAGDGGARRGAVHE